MHVGEELDEQLGCGWVIRVGIEWTKDLIITELVCIYYVNVDSPKYPSRPTRYVCIIPGHFAPHSEQTTRNTIVEILF